MKNQSFGSPHNVIISLAPSEQMNSTSPTFDSSTKAIPEKTHWCCHKDVLKSNSNYFDAIFSSQFQEAEASVIFLSRGVFSAPVLDNILHYMYFKQVNSELKSESRDLQQLKLLQSTYLAADYLGISNLCLEIIGHIANLTHSLVCYCESCSLLLPHLLVFTGSNQQNDPNLCQITNSILKLFLQDPEKTLPTYWTSESMAKLLTETSPLHSYLESGLLEHIGKNNAIETLHGCFLGRSINSKRQKHWLSLVATQKKAKHYSSKLLANNFDFYCTKYPKLLPCVDGIIYSSDFLSFLIDNTLSEMNENNAISLYDGIVRSLMCRDTVQRTPTVKQILHKAKGQTIRFIAAHLSRIKQLGPIDKNLVDVLAQDLMVPASILLDESEPKRNHSSSKKASTFARNNKNMGMNASKLRSRLYSVIFGQTLSRFKINQRVQLLDRPIPTFGTIKYVGRLNGKEDEFSLGIELDRSVGSNDGSFNGKRYFRTFSNRGIFVKPSQVLLI